MEKFFAQVKGPGGLLVLPGILPDRPHVWRATWRCDFLPAVSVLPCFPVAPLFLECFHRCFLVNPHTLSAAFRKRDFSFPQSSSFPWLLALLVAITLTKAFWYSDWAWHNLDITHILAEEMVIRWSSPSYQNICRCENQTIWARYTDENMESAWQNGRTAQNKTNLN